VPARILVVEDNPTNMELMTYLLKAFGHSVFTHRDGAGAVEAVREHMPDLVICDVHLPNMDGYEIARVLGSDPVLSKIPLIAVTAHAMVGDKDKLLAAGFDGYLAKPIDPERFVPQLQSFLESEKRHERPAPHAGGVRSHLMPAGAVRGDILVVDDSAVNRNLMETLLVPSGYTVRVAEGVESALAMARESLPDLILTDVHMPGRTGYDLVKAVREDPILKSIPCVMISSTGLDAGWRSRATVAGVQLVILRPIEPEDLLREIEQHLHKLRSP